MAKLAGTATEAADNNVRDEEFSKEETQRQLLTKEQDIIAGLLAAAAYRNEELRTIEIVREGKLYFSFDIHALGEEEANKCRKMHTRFVRNKTIGVKFAEEVNSAKFRSSLIYHSTIPEHRERLWDNKELWRGLIAQGNQIVTALDVIEAVLLGGEKDRVIEEINKLSGFNSENLEEVETALEETAKN